MSRTSYLNSLISFCSEVSRLTINFCSYYCDGHVPFVGENSRFEVTCFELFLMFLRLNAKTLFLLDCRYFG